MTQDDRDGSMGEHLDTLWQQAKTSADYNEGPWNRFHDRLTMTTKELARCKLELARYHMVTRIIQEIVVEHDERVPRGTI